ncbi:hydroxymethylglutaryl-CoA synthase [Salinibacillus kushneri]|uniref:Hydroxymethylglutaryl-CoA synthase n=1 Tax=Salinibacillus kushneri TaxID=237682 RepID=A0A1I0AAX5_9BACI|nr:hydroxymethylglutaryl-CoA synthase [Salinibacillus kushneri]SES91317.1 hydroxymethylglutaryl-CoA synthase [Salinibacillus kushneri]
MQIGIDKIGFYTPQMYIDMNELAEARDVDPAKFTIGIGQERMAVPPITQDAVTLAANAALEILTDEDKQQIDYVIFATESGIDQSKAAAIYVHRLLGLNPNARSVEVKEACFGATAGIQMAKGHIALHPESKVLVLGSDISRYGLNTGGEVTQGAGAVAMIISANPRIMTIDEPSVYHTEDIMDFWRPNYSDVAFVDGKFSNEKYISFFQNVWGQYQTKTEMGLADFDAICFHMPYTKMGLKALKSIFDEETNSDQDRLMDRYEISKTYNKLVGNIYTGALYLSLISLLELNTDIEPGARIGLYSYGSGAVGEFFSGILQPGYKEVLKTAQHQKLLEERKALSVAEYEDIFQEGLPTDGSSVTLPVEEDPAVICLGGIENHSRHYVNKNR